MAINISNLRPSKIYSNWDFWFENKPSGNPTYDLDLQRKRCKKLQRHEKPSTFLKQIYFIRL
jgi:hypothetical protein